MRRGEGDEGTAWVGSSTGGVAPEQLSKQFRRAQVRPKPRAVAGSRQPLLLLSAQPQPARSLRSECLSEETHHLQPSSHRRYRPRSCRNTLRRRPSRAPARSDHSSSLRVRPRPRGPACDALSGADFRVSAVQVSRCTLCCSMTLETGNIASCRSVPPLFPHERLRGRS